MLRCQNCDRKVPRLEARTLATVGHDLAYFGWSYHVAYVGKTNRGRSFNLPEPSGFLWALGSFFALSVASGLAYDTIKRGATVLYRKYRQRAAVSERGTISDSEAIRMLPELHQWAVQYLRKGGAQRLRASGFQVDGLSETSRYGMTDIEVTQMRIQIPTSKKRRPRRRGADPGTGRRRRQF